MSIWQIIVAVVFLFAIAFCLSFQRKKTAFRTTMRVLAIGIPISLFTIFCTLEYAVNRGCYSSEQNFYERKDALCYGTGRITQVTIGDRELEIDRFMVLSKNKVVIHTKDGGDFVGSYANGTFIVKWLDDLVY